MFGIASLLRICRDEILTFGFMCFQQQDVSGYPPLLWMTPFAYCYKSKAVAIALKEY
jgi:hypothetical protein